MSVGVLLLALLALLIPTARGSLLTSNLFPADNPWNQNVSQAPVATPAGLDLGGCGWAADFARPGRPDEALPTSQGGQGIIRHALRFTLPNAVILNKHLYPDSSRAMAG